MRVRGGGFRVFMVRASGFRFVVWVRGGWFGVRCWGLRVRFGGFRVRGLKLQVRGVGVGVSGFAMAVWGFTFGVLGFRVFEVLHFDSSYGFEV